MKLRKGEKAEKQLKRGQNDKSIQRDTKEQSDCQKVINQASAMLFSLDDNDLPCISITFRFQCFCHFLF